MLNTRVDIYDEAGRAKLRQSAARLSESANIDFHTALDVLLLRQIRARGYELSVLPGALAFLRSLHEQDEYRAVTAKVLSILGPPRGLKSSPALCTGIAEAKASLEGHAINNP